MSTELFKQQFGSWEPYTFSVILSPGDPPRKIVVVGPSVQIAEMGLGLSDQGQSATQVPNELQASLAKLQLAISRREKAIIYDAIRRFMIAGTTAVDAVKAAAMRVRNPFAKGVLGKMVMQMFQGIPVGAAMESVSEAFGEVDVATMRAADESGEYDRILERLVEATRASAGIMTKVIGSLVYPIILLVVITGVAYYASTEILPTLIGELTQDFELDELPPVTRTVKTYLNFVGGREWIITLPAAIVILFGIYTPRIYGNQVVQEKLLKMPLVGPTLSALSLSRSMTTLSLMLDAGTTYEQAFGAAKKVSGNSVFKRYFQAVLNSITGGDSIYRAFLKANSIVPGEITFDIAQIMKTAEGSGVPAEVINRAAMDMREQANRRVSSMVALVGPLGIVFVVGGVGLVAIAIAIPSLEMAQVIMRDSFS